MLVVEVVAIRNLDRRVAPVIMFSTVETTSAGTIGGVEVKMSSSTLLLIAKGRFDREVILSFRWLWMDSFKGNIIVSVI